MRKLSVMIVLFVLLYVAANLSVAYFGVWSTPINALVIISADMVIRDKIQHNFGFWYSMLACFVAGIATVIIDPSAGMIAVASVSSVILAGTGSAITFKLKRGDFYSKSIPANTVSAAIDSIVFPMIAFGSVMIDVSLAQFAAKTVGAFIIIAIMRKFKL